MRKALFLFSFIISFLFSTFSVEAVGSESVCLIDGDTNTVLYQKNMDVQNLTASIAKIATAIVAIENVDVFASVTITEGDMAEGSSVYLKPGDTVLFIDLLYGLMLRSGNDCAMAIANNTFGKYDLFIKEMNLLCRKLGLNNTTFENPSGLDETTKNYSTAYDMSILMSYCMGNEIFREVTKAREYTADINGPVTWYQKHKLINTNEYVIGGKTGYTTKAGRTLISVYEKDGKQLICVTFKIADDYNLHLQLFEEYIDKVTMKLVLEAQVLKQELELDFYPLVKDDIYLPIASDSIVTIKFVFYDIVDDVCGEILVYQNDTLLYEDILYVYRLEF
ncbi:MAG: serine hydrolase [bacterium]